MRRMKVWAVVLALMISLVMAAVGARGTKAKWENGYLLYYDANTYETIQAMTPVWFSSDFDGPALDTTNDWVVWDYKGGTETQLADQPNGVAQLLLTSANESQTAGIDYNDEKQIRNAYAPNVEFRIRFTTLPAGSSTAIWGMYGSRNDDLDTIGESIWFRCNGDGAVLVENDDTSNETTVVSSGITILANAWHIYRIEMTQASDCKFYIDGARVASSTTFKMNNSTTLQLQPGAVLIKTDSSGLGVMEIDYVRVWSDRQ